MIKRRILGSFLAFCIFLIPFVSGCSNINSSQQNSQFHIIVPDGGPVFSVSALATNVQKSGSEFQVKGDVAKEFKDGLSIQIAADADALITGVLKNNPEAAIVPVNLLSKLSNYKIAGVTTWGNNVIIASKAVQNDVLKNKQNLTSFKEIPCPLIYYYQSNNVPGLTLKSILKKQNLEFKDTKSSENILLDCSKPTLVDNNTPSQVQIELTKRMKDANSAAFYAMLPEPLASAFLLKNKDSYVFAADLQKMWEDIYQKDYPQSVLVVRSDYADNSQNTYMIKNFIESVRTSLYAATRDPITATNIATQKLHSASLPANPQIIKQAIDKGTFKLSFVDAIDAKDGINEYLNAVGLKGYTDDMFYISQ